MSTESTMQLAPMAPAVGEIATTAAASMAVATVQARYAIALARPRNLLDVRARLMADCKRPAFAEVARYDLPVGGGKRAQGPSIRFVEAALRAYTNVLREVTVGYDTVTQRCVRVVITDLESNVTHQSDILIDKTVERKQVKEGQRVLGKRLNSYGDWVYLVDGTERDIKVKQAAEVSKAIRELGLRILPGDLVAECEAEVVRTKLSKAREDPEAERKRIADAFFGLGIEPSELEKYLRHPLKQSVPEEIVELRDVFVSIRDGETTWRDIMDERFPSDPASESDSKKTKETEESKTESRTQRAAERVRAAKAAREANGGGND